MDHFYISFGVSTGTHFVLIPSATTVYYRIPALLYRVGPVATLLQQGAPEYVHLSPQCRHLSSCVSRLQAHAVQLQVWLMGRSTIHSLSFYSGAKESSPNFYREFARSKTKSVR